MSARPDPTLEPFDQPAGLTPTLANPESALLVLRRALHPVHLETEDVRDPGPPDGCIQPTVYPDGSTMAAREPGGGAAGSPLGS